jgi:hypothetical protein
MERRHRTKTGARALLVALACATSVLACATTQVSDDSSSWWGRVPRPERILVRSFATNPQEVELDHSLTAVAGWKLEGVTASAERQDVAHQVADALADELVKKIQALGMPAEHWRGPLPADADVLLVDGQFLAIDEGSRTERIVIGLGAGKSDVRTAVQIVEILPEGSHLLDAFEVTAKSGATPGMAETMGAGAAAGHLATAAVVGVGKSVASEEFGDNVEADAQRTAEQISKMLSRFFVRQGWIPPPSSSLP